MFLAKKFNSQGRPLGDFAPEPAGIVGGMWWRREKQEVTEFLYKLLITDAPRSGFAREVAERMAVPYPTLSKYWTGKRRFPAALVSPLFLATGEDARVAEFFLLKGSRHRLQRKEDAPVTLEVAEAVMTVSELAGKISGLCRRASSPESEEGRRISKAEAAELALATRTLIDAAEELRAALAATTPASKPG